MVPQTYSSWQGSSPNYRQRPRTEPATPGRGAQRSRAEASEASAPDSAVTVEYPFVRSVLAPEYASLPNSQLKALMEAQYGEGAAEQYDEYLEGFFGDVGKFISNTASDVGKFAVKAAPVVTNIAGGVVRGATSGASLGLPGIIGGAVAGGVGQGFASYGSGTLRDIGKGINSGVDLAGQFSGTGRIGNTLGGALSGIGQGKNVLNTALGAASGLAGGALGGGALGGGALGRFAGLAGGQGGAGGAISSLAGLAGGQGGASSAVAGLLGGGQGGSAAGQLVGLLQRPEVLQSLGAMAMGRLGTPNVRVGSAQTPVPTSSFLNLLMSAVNRASDEQAALSDGSETDLRYLTDDAGEWVADPADSDQRAAQLNYLLNVAELERMIQAEQQMQLQQLQQQQLQQQELRRQVAHQEQLRQARAWQRQLERETALYDAVDLAETFALTEDIGEYDESDEGAFDEGGFDEYDEYDEYEE